MEDLDILSPARTGKLSETPSAFSDFWGTVMGFELVPGVDDESGRLYRNAEMSIRMDMIGADGTNYEVTERYPLPTDEKTGGPRLTKGEDGEMVNARPNATSKWGRQERLYESIGVPWEGDADNLIGLHAHFLERGVKITRAQVQEEAAKKARGERVPSRPRGDFPFGRYVVEWDSYNNEIRAQRKLSAITTTYTAIAEEAGAVPSTSNGNRQLSQGEALVEIARIAVGKDYLETYAALRTNHPELVPFFPREAITSLVNDGLLVEKKDGTKVRFAEGPNLS